MSRSRRPSPSAQDRAAGPSSMGEDNLPLHWRIWQDKPHPDIINGLQPVVNDGLKEGMPDTEFNRTYPPDAWCEETAANARVWKICRDEATASDKDMLKSWNKTLDVLLIFAGLFSAVSTAFIVESYKTLQPDHSQYIAAFLYSAAVAYHTNGSALPPLDAILSPDSSFQSAPVERWINGLWFISLAVSLLVALLSILVKQWLDEYHARVSRSAENHENWARRHALYNAGLQSWGVPVIISCLPLLLHVSLSLFLAGLVLFLRLLDEAIARGLLILLTSVLGFYILSMVLPVFSTSCPSTTPVLQHACLTLLVRLSNHLAIPSRSRRIAASVGRWVQSLRTKETVTILATTDGLTATALAGLVNRTDDPNILSVVAESLGGFASNTIYPFIREHIEECNRICEHVRLEDRQQLRDANANAFEATSFARRQRALLALSNVLPDDHRFLRGSQSLDLQAALGIEGALLSVLFRWEYASRPGESDQEAPLSQVVGPRNLVAAMRALNWIPELGPFSRLLVSHQWILEPNRFSVPPSSRLHLPLRLLFLQTAARLVQGGARDPLSYTHHFYSLVVLVFCAGSPAYHESDELAAGHLATIVGAGGVVSRISPCITLGNGPGDVDAPNMRDLTRAGYVNNLYFLLTHAEKYKIHPDVANLVAPYVLASFAEIIPPLPWSHLQGLSSFIVSEVFEQHTPSIEMLTGYIITISRASRDVMACDSQRIRDFLCCCSVLAARAESLDLTPKHHGYYELRQVVLEITRYLCGSPRIQNEVLVLSHLLADAAGFGHWMKIHMGPYDVETDIPAHLRRRELLFPLEWRTLLPGALAASLRRRQRTQLDIDPAWIHVLISDRSVLGAAESVLELWTGPDDSPIADESDSRDQTRLHQLRSFLRHLRQLSPSSWASLCNCPTASGLSPEALERFRNGIFPGDSDGAGALDCHGECDCMRPYQPDQNLRLAEDTVPADPGSRARLTRRFKHWKPWSKRELAVDAGQGVCTVSDQV